MAEEFIGAGLAFPLRTDAAGRFALVNRDAELQESMRLILGTAFGERPMRPEFGCGIHDLVFAPADDTTAGRVAYEVQASLVRWEPRIEVLDVDVSFSSGAASTMYVDVSYTPRGTNDPRNLVFPFYTIPMEE
ncbi:MAG: GPW/gp25 family protein [Acidimicrobiia bacterium]